MDLWSFCHTLTFRLSQNKKRNYDKKWCNKTTTWAINEWIIQLNLIHYYINSLECQQIMFTTCYFWYKIFERKKMEKKNSITHRQLLKVYIIWRWLYRFSIIVRKTTTHDWYLVFFLSVQEKHAKFTSQFTLDNHFFLFTNKWWQIKFIIKIVTTDFSSCTRLWNLFINRKKQKKTSLIFASIWTVLCRCKNRIEQSYISSRQTITD